MALPVGVVRIAVAAAGLAILLGARTATAADLHVPSDYTTIQSAIDAAVDGDAILLAPESHFIGAELTVEGKRLAIRGEGGVAALKPTFPDLAELRIEEGADVELTDLSLELPLLASKSSLSLTRVSTSRRFTFLDGESLLAVDCSLRGNGSSALSVSGAESVELRGGSLEGGTGSSGGSPFGSEGGVGYAGLRATACPNVRLSGVELRGGRGGLGGSSFSAGFSGGAGGPGASLVEGTIVVAENVNLIGGPGGAGGVAFSIGPSGGTGPTGAIFVADASSSLTFLPQGSGWMLR
jgi:hypothetical protein